MPWRVISVLVVTLVVALLPGRPASDASDRIGSESDGRYVGSAACSNCHEAEHAAWTGSYHALAWTLPSPTTVRADFDGTSFTHASVTTRFERDGEAYVVVAPGAKGPEQRFAVVGVAGWAPLQQYLIETEPGRVQTLDIGWDVVERRWYPVFPDHVVHGPSDGLHWTGPYKSWNARCAECHATGYSRNYDQATRSYAPRQAEIGVGCEACHGPGQAHVNWAEAPGAFSGTGNGLTFDIAASAEAEIQQCAQCHSRREPFLDGNPPPGIAFHDAYRLALLRPGLYHADGQIREEVYVYGSFLQSKMYARGVRCSDCHDPHGARLELSGDAVCTQCHSPAGEPRFPTLRLADYAAPEHHFHDPRGEGARCVNCHMIERFYMGIDGRRDHGFRVPRPDISARVGTPDACTDCHADEGAAWAAAEIAQRYPESVVRDRLVAVTFAAAAADPSSQAADLLAIAERGDLPGIVRASALDFLQPVADPAIAARAAWALDDPDPLLREAATALQVGLPAGERPARLQASLEDPLRAVRIAAARALLDVPTDGQPPALAEPMRRAFDEWEAAQRTKADFPEAQLALGGAALAARDTRSALHAFRETVTLDRELVAGWIMLTRIHWALGRPDRARAVLAEALAFNPSAPELQELARRLGLRGHR
ncbi:MAG: cytochrome c3 family protein [Pseudomonadota bacterium]